ncbi:MAG: hypothetical protein H7833_19400 [Magnetococcus sp. DMHC-1]|nr:hypothetical protein [Magnetococcales bacterium]
MNEEKFLQIWNNICVPTIGVIIEEAGGKIEFDLAKREGIFAIYKENRSAAKKFLRDGADQLLDRHKVVSCFQGAIIGASPLVPRKDIVFEQKDPEWVHLYLANEMLAFSASLNLMHDFVLDRATVENNNTDQVIFGKFKDKFHFPECQHVPFKVHAFRVLNYEKRHSVYNIFSWSMIFFWIEAYTRMSRIHALENSEAASLNTLNKAV